MDDRLPLTETEHDILYTEFLHRCASIAEAVPMSTMAPALGKMDVELLEMWGSDDPAERGKAYLGWRKSMGFSVQETDDGEIVEIPIEEL